jgi:hypothetical protein
MRHARGFLTVLPLVLAPAAAWSADTGKFDGDWQTTVSCAAARDALGYAFRFVSTVKNGTFHGSRGIAGQAPYLQIDGKIGPDGNATLYADGLTGSKEYVPGRDTPRGTPYNYSISAHFDAATGSGTRVEGRPCTFQFTRQ